jgi:hypothetical protein
MVARARGGLSILAISSTSGQPFRHIGVTDTHAGANPAPHHESSEQMNMTKMTAATLPVGSSAKFFLATAALALTLLAIPHGGHAQGIVRGAQQGAREGNRVAGPVGGVVGGAVGAGVGGAVGAVKGVFGIPDRGYRCRGYYDHHRHFHCYR